MKRGFLITARLKSTRYPLKILQDLNGRTVIERVIDRTKAVEGISEIVLCTSTNPQDRPLVDLALKNNIYYYTGDEVDVLKRLLDAASFYELDSVLSVTADNPLFSIYHANLVAESLRTTNCDYVRTEGLPIGAAVYGVKTKALRLVCQIKSLIDTEIWGLFFNQPRIFDIEVIKAYDNRFNPDDYRLTLDYPEDYQLMNHIYSNICFTSTLNLENVVDYLSSHPEIAALNRNCTQLNLSDEQINRINAYFTNNQNALLELKHQIYQNDLSDIRVKT